MKKDNKSFLSKLTESRNFGLVMVLIVIVIIAAIVTPTLFQPKTFIGMIQNNAVFGILAIAEMLVIITGGIDISSLPSSVSARPVCRLTTPPFLLSYGYS